MGDVIPFPRPPWIAAYRHLWLHSLDRLDTHLDRIRKGDAMSPVNLIASNDEPIVADNKTLVITRTLNAPRALVWKMFADPYHLAQWWGPEGFTNRVERLDFRTGGSWRHVMIGPDGHEFPTDNVILEVTEPERIVYRNAPADPKIFGDNPPPAFTKTVTFEDVGGKTLLTLLCTFDTEQHREAIIRRGFSLGTNQSFDKLEDYLGTL